MKKFNTINLRWLLLGVVVPILLFLFIGNIVYAYFTATTGNKGTITTGSVIVAFSDSTKTSVKSNKVIIEGNKILPGQDVNVAGAVVNKGESNIYAILEVSIHLEDMTPICTNYYTADGVLLNIENDVSSTAATAISASKSVNFDIDYNIDFFDYGNEYMGRNLIVTYQALAIQYSNIADGVEACNILLELFKEDDANKLVFTVDLGGGCDNYT